MKFTVTDFNGMRVWLSKISRNSRVRRARLICFDLMRYREAYDEIYQYIETMGGQIIKDE